MSDVRIVFGRWPFELSDAARLSQRRQRRVEKLAFVEQHPEAALVRCLLTRRVARADLLFARLTGGDRKQSHRTYALSTQEILRLVDAPGWTRLVAFLRTLRSTLGRQL